MSKRKEHDNALLQSMLEEIRAVVDKHPEVGVILCLSQRVEDSNSLDTSCCICGTHSCTIIDTAMENIVQIIETFPGMKEHIQRMKQQNIQEALQKLTGDVLNLGPIDKVNFN